MNLIIIEDEEAHFQLMKRSLEKQFPESAIHHFNDPPAFIKQLHEVNPDVIIVDYLMPGMNGIELLEFLNEKEVDAPVIMITGQGDEHVAVQAIKLGAQDYLVKSSGFFTLIPSVVQKAIREKRLKDSVAKNSHLNDLLLNSLPQPAMLIKRDRTVLAANRVAQELGAKIGGYCWRDIGQGKNDPEDLISPKGTFTDLNPCVTKCSYCLGDVALERKEPKHVPEVHDSGRIWDIWWLPIDDEVFFHYGIDITDRKHAEEFLRASENRLRCLSAQLLRAQENERKRIAGEIHDSIGSGLTAVKMYLENMLNKHHPGVDRTESLGHATSMLQQLLDESRRIMNDLRPSLLDDLGIVKTISWFCRQFQMIHPDVHIESKVEIVEDGMPESIKIVVFRVLQEAFQNIAKYSKAELVHLSFVPVNDAIELIIGDNGIGFDLDAPQLKNAKYNSEGGLGLESMRERVELSGGSFRIESIPGRGTKIYASWPCANLDL